MSCTSDDQSNRRHVRKGWGHADRTAARLSPTPEEPPAVWFPGAQVQKGNGPAESPGGSTPGSGAEPTLTIAQGVSVKKSTGSFRGSRRKTGRPSVKITPLTGPSLRRAEPSLR
jgi:hypothetical protein